MDEIASERVGISVTAGAFKAIVVIKNDIALITERNLLSAFCCKIRSERGLTAIVVLINLSGTMDFQDKRQLSENKNLVQD